MRKIKTIKLGHPEALVDVTVQPGTAQEAFWLERGYTQADAQGSAEAAATEATAEPEKKEEEQVELEIGFDAEPDEVQEAPRPRRGRASKENTGE